LGGIRSKNNRIKYRIPKRRQRISVILEKIWARFKQSPSAPAAEKTTGMDADQKFRR